MKKLSTSLILCLVIISKPFIIFSQITGELPPSGNPVILKSCLGLETTLAKQPDGKSYCCYKVSVNNTWQPISAPYSLTLEIKSGAITDAYSLTNGWTQAPSNVQPQVKKIVWSRQPSIPTGKVDIANLCIRIEKPTWVHFTWLNQAGDLLCRDSTLLGDCIYEPESICKNQLIQNGGFTPSVPATQMPVNWAKGYGNPQFFDTQGGGCFDPGFVELSGNKNSGDAIMQSLMPNKKIIKGRRYILQVAVKFTNTPNGPGYCRLRAMGWNLSLGSNGQHPKPSFDIYDIGRSGKIRACNDWTIIEFPIWRAPKDLSGIAIAAFTDSPNETSKIKIDNISICETDLTGDCDEITLDAAEKPVPPPGYGPPSSNLGCPIEAEVDEYENGSLQNLYGQLYGYDGTTNWYANAVDKCFSLGGTIPLEASKPMNCEDSLKTYGINMTCEQFQNALNNPDLSKLPKDIAVRLPVIPPPTNVSCQYNPPPTEVQMPFKGRDIIFIHGLQLSHLCDRATGIPGAGANWPVNKDAFYKGGYYKNVAVNNLDSHITHYLKGKGYNNRYLIVSYNCSQNAEIAIHSVLTQIREAMETGKDVELTNPADPRGTTCFGRDYILVSHSTGAIVADVALAIANLTKTDAAMKKNWGDIGLISDRCKGRVSFRGAFTGSNLATAYVGFQAPLLSQAASLILSGGICNGTFSSSINQQMVSNSILVDLVPMMTQLRWGKYLDKVPVPVLDLSGAHPSAIIPPFLKYYLHSGYDDGVLNMDCTVSSKVPFTTQPARFAPTSAVRVFDMGQSGPRAAFYYRDQYIKLNICASGASPWLSPTGMVQPVKNVISSANYYANHYPFVQSASEHWMRKDYSSGNYDITWIDGSKNHEEQLVINDITLFNNNLVSKDIIGEMGENIKERVIWFPTLRIKTVGGIPRPITVWKKFYIWKRTYHRFQNPSLYDYDYAYRYLFNK